MSYQEQLKGEDWIGFQRSKTDNIVGLILTLALLIICVIFLVNRANSEANYQSRIAACATPTPVNGFIVPIPCDVGSSGSASTNDCFLFLVMAATFIAFLWFLIQTVAGLRQRGLYIFDRRTNSFSLDGVELAHLSDIKAVMVKQRVGEFFLDIVYKDDNSTRLSTFRLSGEANDAADQLAIFIGVPKTHGSSLF